MEFPVPTTKAEMYETLYYLYRHYRMLKNDFQNVERQSLTLPRLTYELKTDAELYEEAQLLLADKHQREIDGKRDALVERRTALSYESASIVNQYESNVRKIESEYEKAVLKVKDEATERGVYGSCVLDKIAELENEKAQVLANLASEKQKKVIALDNQIVAIRENISNVESYFQTLHEKEIRAKQIELIREQKDRELQYLKFNNSQEEKEIKYANALIQSDANLELTYMRIKSESLSREMLLKMGYYSDVLRCINQYYSTMTRVRAYNEVMNEPDLSLFLDDSYQNFLYQYRTAAIDEQNGITFASLE